MKKVWFENTKYGLKPVTPISWILSAICLLLPLAAVIEIYSRTYSWQVTWVNFLAYAILLSAMYLVIAYKTSEKSYWFRNKLYGWGWTPNTWQGWWLILLSVMLITTAVSVPSLEDYNIQEGLFNSFLVVVLLLLVCYKTGEKPRFRWGKDS